MRRLTLLVFVLLAIAWAASPPAEAQTGGAAPAPNEQKEESGSQQDEDFGDKCRPGVPGLNEVLDAACDVGKTAEEQVTGAPGAVVENAVGGALDEATEWMTEAATWTTRQIAAGIEKTSTPELKASWYRERFGSMVALGL